jgi:hypothetical protein
VNQAQPYVDDQDVQFATMRLHVDSPLNGGATPMHLQQIAQAKKTGKSIRQAVIVSRISAWTTLVFAIGTLVSSLTSLGGLMLGIGMAVVSIVEFKGGTALKCLDVTAPRRLAINQLVFGGLLFSYAAMCLWTSSTTTSTLTSDPQLQQMLAPFRDIEKTIYTLVYGAMMAAAVIGPGLTSLYYWGRIKHIQRYLAETPKWILELQEAGMSL